MKYLRDVNALVTLGLIHHEFHERVAAWVRAQRFPPPVTCSITELGFVRVLAQAPAYALAIAQARSLLLRLKKASALSVTFIPDGHDISHLPETTDGHLVQLASSNGAVLATLDGKIPGAYLIPQRHVG